MVDLSLESEKTGDSATPRLAGKKILLVEDDRFLHRLINDKFTQWKATVVSSFDGADVPKMAAEEKPDIIILDLILPEADGFEILKELKGDDNLKNVPVIILSNLGQEEDVKKGTELGAENFLIKANFTLDEIAEKVSSAIKE